MKHKIHYSIALVLLLGSQAFSQTYVTQVKPAGSKTWGYANLKGELIIPAQYAKCYKFSAEGLAPIYDTEKRQYHFITLKGETLTTSINGFKLIDGFGTDVNGFSHGLAPVKMGEKWGFINSTGKVVIDTKYDKVDAFEDDYTIVLSGTNHVILDTKGTETLIVVSDLADVKQFSEHLAPYRATNKTFGFIGVNGKVSIPAQFESVGYFHEGLAWAKQTGGVLGYINTKGEWVIKPQFTAGKEFESESGLARVKVGEQWAYVSKAGEILYVKDTEKFEDFSNGLALGKKGEKFGFYNNKGQWTIPPQFDGARDFKNGYAAAKLGDKWGIINKEGKWVIQPQFDGIKDMELVK